MARRQWRSAVADNGDVLILSDDYRPNLSQRIAYVYGDDPEANARLLIACVAACERCHEILASIAEDHTIAEQVQWIIADALGLKPAQTQNA